MNLTNIVTFIQFFFAIVIGLYFWNLLKSQQGNKVAVERESKKEIEKLRRLRSIHLSEPLSEKTRPTRFDEIVGQQEGIRALKAALCGPNPQHIIVYGPPGVGKTAAARLVLEEAKKTPWTPFQPDAKFVELDATTARFDERGIADPLIGSVHDPIYQGAGPLGMAGIPQPKPGAVTKAHGGILFIDEIGELHPIQLNKLLKVLEDRKVMLESAYYNSEDSNVPTHIQDIFENGLPADFRLIGATTRQPHEIPPAIRSRCVEVFFRALLPDEIQVIATNAVNKLGMEAERGAIDVVKRYATNGREAVNLIQIACGLALTEGRRTMTQADVEWVVTSGQYNPRPDKKVGSEPQVGVVNGLAVYGPNLGTVIDIEAVANPVSEGSGQLYVTGIVDEEEMGTSGRTIRRKSMARGSIENVLTVLRNQCGVEPRNFDLHVNFPGGVPLDGPSAGVAIATALYSAMTGKPCDGRLAMTGELSIRGYIKPVGGIVAKVEAAKQAGCTRVLIPRDNWQQAFADHPGIEIIAIDRLQEAIDMALAVESTKGTTALVPTDLLTASPSASMPS
ncbi:ATP-dependent protease LonB [Sulfobacillus thermosulfidooxidans]|uniref:endopeptidase La n=1 Tax=Sulfobacillus thermosulfidooxidans TaxID=28034 RepID=A0A1R0IKQ3_SULTH|nr:ATP-dependent protease LonB [Sulfobacillus thermosulfidooxidans]OLZ10854.1 ATP-dependent protease LonB [Sulfobacillus thermosulfidooxidans]OLZ14342.1 ATP-dependent protease LonB [Sulfobacillus thermosulfidooxidans]OLZ19085.1 ATP-dependent protease LonB [Sulfobacillus thermosulfidooxidans]PSR28539.1 MAG: ATP-dependent protease LonB [Sulfobacillus thermosulfidooxidans]